MKKLVIFIAGICLLAACQNDIKNRDKEVAAIFINFEQPAFTKDNIYLSPYKDTANILSDQQFFIDVDAEFNPVGEVAINPEDCQSGTVVYYPVIGPEKVIIRNEFGWENYFLPITVRPDTIPDFDEEVPQEIIDNFMKMIPMGKDLKSVGIYGCSTHFSEPEIVHDNPYYKVKYTATVKLAIPIACILIRNITFKRLYDMPFNYKLKSMYIDGVNDFESGETVGYTEGKGYNRIDPIPFMEATNIRHVDNFYDISEEESNKFMNEGASLPIDDKSILYYHFPIYGYNSNPDGYLPQIKFEFEEIPINPNDSKKPLYASIESYYDVNGNLIKTFDPGKLYIIDELEITQDNLSVSPNNHGKYSIKPIVDVQNWGDQTITGGFYKNE